MSFIEEKKEDVTPTPSGRSCLSVRGNAPSAARKTATLTGPRVVIDKEKSGLRKQPSEEGAVFLSDESDSAEFDCPVCLELMWKPVQTPCNHIFCERCLHDVIKSVQGSDKDLVCPLCRSNLEGFDTEGALPLIRDKELEAIIKKKKPKEFKQRKSQKEKDELMNIRLELCYGNTHELLHNEKRSKHLCVMYFKANNKDVDLTKLIRYIRLHLWKSTRRLVPPIFQCSLRCWGTFDIKFEVFWEKVLALEPTTYTHALSFSPDSNSISFLAIPRKAVERLGALKRPKNVVRRARRRGNRAGGWRR